MKKKLLLTFVLVISVGLTLKAQCPVVDQTVSATTPIICPNTSTTINVGSSETGVEYFLMNGSAVVSGPVSGNGSSISYTTGNLSSTTTYSVYGANPSNAIATNASNFMRVASPTGLPTGNVVTAEAWVYPTGYSDVTYNGIVTYGPRDCSPAGRSFLMSMTNQGRPSMATWCNDFVPNTGPTAVLNTWNHIACVINGTSVKLYLNGYEWSGTIANPTIVSGPLTIGSTDNSGRNFVGRIDDVRIWNVARTAQEIRDNRLNCYSASEPNLVSCYKFEEGAGATVADVMGLNNGTLIGTPTWVSGSATCSPCFLTMSQTTTVTVQDNAATVASTPGNLSVNVDAGTCGAVVNYTAPTFDDDCDGTGLSGTMTTSGTASGATFPVGVTTVSFDYTDGSSNVTTETFTITVTDNEAPVTPILSALTDECSVTATAPTTTDNCAGTVTGTTSDLLTYSAEGTYTINWTFADGNGNSTSATQTVTIDDVTAPVVSNCPSNISVNADQAGCTAIVTWTAPTANDNCVGAVTPTSTHNSGDSFSEGTTTVTYTFDDGNGNTSQCSFDVTVTNSMMPSSIDQMVSCNGGTDGAIDVTIVGGNAPITYSWTGPNGFTSTNEDVTGLEAGQYFPTATDAAGCMVSGTIDITEPTAININVDGTSNPTACATADGTAMVTVTGGTVASTYAYSWSDGASYTSSTEDPTDMPAGTITITVTDDNGCTANTNISLSDPNGPTVALGSTAVTTVLCNGDMTGDAQIDVTLNGTATSATYLWDDTNATTTEDLSGLGAGTYTVEVTDNNNCVTSFGVTITEPSAITGSISSMNVSCNGGTDASIDLTVSGGNGSFTYLWDDTSVSTTEDLNGVGAGTYTVIITDGNNCTGTTNVTITEPTALAGSGISTDEISGGDGTIDLTVTGGTPTYTYVWTGPNSFTSTSEDLSGLSTGTYDVTITDGNGCTTTVQVVVGTQVGVSEIDENSFVVYPNPTTGIFMVKGTLSGRNTIKVMDATGRLLLVKENCNTTTTLDLSVMEKGVYFVQVTNGSSNKTIRIVLNK